MEDLSLGTSVHSVVLISNKRSFITKESIHRHTVVQRSSIVRFEVRIAIKCFVCCLSFHDIGMVS